MNKKKLICLFLASFLLIGCLFTVGCNNKATQPPEDADHAGTDDIGDSQITDNSDSSENDDNNESNENNYTLGNIKNNIAEYTLIRSDKATQIVKNAIVLARTTIQEATDAQLKIGEDWVEDLKSEHEILIGQTNRPESAEAMKMLSEQNPYAITQINGKICVVGVDEYAVRRAIYEFLTVYFGYELPNHNYHNVIDYGAEGDGVRDDTESFRAAVAAAEKDGLPVYVPGGTYLISDTIELYEVTLYGYHSGAWTADDSDLPVIVQTNLELPVFDVVAGSLSGLLIDVKGVTKNMDFTPAETIRLSHAGARVSNMKIINPYIGISTFYNGGANPGRCFIENIFIVNAYKIGVNVHSTWDVATLCNIEVWNPYTSGENKNSCEVAFKFGKNDDLRAVNLFTFNSKIGFLFEESDIGGGVYEGCWGSFTNCSTDLCETGLKVAKGQHALTVIGGTYWNHFYGLDVTSKTSNLTRITMTGCELKTNGDTATVNVAGGQMVTVTGCNISRTQSDHKGVPVKISGGTGVNVSGNTICANGTAAVEITSSFKGAATVTGNTIITSQSSAASAISGKASERIVIANNAVLTDYKYE